MMRTVLTVILLLNIVMAIIGVALGLSAHRFDAAAWASTSGAWAAFVLACARSGRR